MGAPQLHHFTPAEFVREEDWWPLMSPRLLVLLDVFRYRWGDTVRISPHRRALGRRLGMESFSDHNVDQWGEVRGVDVLPRNFRTRTDARTAVELATRLGFTSIGVYPHWLPSPGLHLGVRADRNMGAPATWGALNVDGKQTYTTLAEAIMEMRLA